MSMDVDNIVWRLAQLASLPYQERYVIGGTIDAYIVDSDLLDNVDSLRYLVGRPENRASINDRQHVVLEELFRSIDRNSTAALSAATREEGAALIREGSAWRDLRDHAARALACFGMDIDSLSIETIDALSE